MVVSLLVYVMMSTHLLWTLNSFTISENGWEIKKVLLNVTTTIYTSEIDQIYLSDKPGHLRGYYALTFQTTTNKTYHFHYNLSRQKHLALFQAVANQMNQTYSVAYPGYFRG